MRARLAPIAAAALLAGGLMLVVAGTSVAPLSHACAISLPDGACEAALGAVMRRGLAGFHPLLLAAQVTPGSEPRSELPGHRATVKLDMLGAPRPLRIELHYDQGAHWGSVADYGDAELAAYALAPIALAGLAGATILGVSRVRLSSRRRRSPAAATDEG